MSDKEIGVCGFDLSRAIVELSLRGSPELAADVILNKEIRGILGQVVGAAIQRFQLEFLTKPESRGKIYSVCIEMALNLIGAEKTKAGFSDDETAKTLSVILTALKEFEIIERATLKNAPIATEIVQDILDEMKHVMLGKSMVSKVAENVERQIDTENLMESFVRAMKKAITENVYYQMFVQGLSKLGNDSATGLRRVRHIGAVQVSSNPVIAARAYEEFPTLWNDFKKTVMEHTEWFDDPEKYGDEIAMYGTVSSLLPNLLVFRPLFLLSQFQDGLVSYQINPFKAMNLQETIEDATKIYSILQKTLEVYDPYFWNTSLKGTGRPNIVFKIAGCGPAAIDITISLNKLGIGTNNTVTYTVSQEVSLILAEMEGMSKAVKMGIPVTQVYETNMIGRLEDHLREVLAEDMMREGLEKCENKESHLKRIAEKIGASDALEKETSYDKKISTICMKRFVKSLSEDRFVNALQDIYGKSKDIRSILEQLEDDIHYSGIYVTRRTYSIFFNPKNRLKWINYIQSQHGVPRKEAEDIMSKIDLLPSSKRRADDTYLVLGSPSLGNLTNTEFPSQQMEVFEKSLQEDFKVSDYKDSISYDYDNERLERLLQINDFRKAFELTPKLTETLTKAGIAGSFGACGLEPEDWPNFGPVVKTLEEFQNAYSEFKKKAIEFVRKVSQEE